MGMRAYRARLRPARQLQNGVVDLSNVSQISVQRRRHSNPTLGADI